MWIESKFSCVLKMFTIAESIGRLSSRRKVTSLGRASAGRANLRRQCAPKGVEANKEEEEGRVETRREERKRALALSLSLGVKDGESGGEGTEV